MPFVESDISDGRHTLAHRRVSGFDRSDARLGDPEGGELDPGRHAFGKGLLLSLGPLGQGHAADRTVARLILHDAGMHRAIELNASGHGGMFRRGPVPLLVIVPDRIPEAKDQARRGHQGDESQPQFNDLDHHPELLPPRQWSFFAQDGIGGDSFEVFAMRMVLRGHDRSLP